MPLSGNILETVVQDHKQDIGMDAVKRQLVPITARIAQVALFVAISSFPSLPPFEASSNQ